MFHRSCGSPAFTLVEVLIVIAIVGILASAVLGSMSTPRINARDKTRITDLKRLSLELDMYKSACREYPDMLSLSIANGCPTGTTLESFLHATPTDPLGVEYGYATSGAGLSYVLRTTMESDNAALVSDLDGVTNNGVSLDCTDSPTRYYCVGL